MNSLAELALDTVITSINKLKDVPLGKNDKEIRCSITQCFEYLIPTGNLSLLIAREINKTESVSLNLLFLPLFVHTGRIILNDDNAREIMKWLFRDIVESCVLHNVVQFDAKSFRRTMKDEDYRLMELLFTKLPGLHEITIGSIPDDRFFNYIHKTCHEIVSLDFHVSHLCGISDAGLKSISTFEYLRNLFIRFNAYSFLDRYTSLLFTSEGIANLLICLPEICEFVCPKHIYFNAFQILLSGKHKLLNLHSIPFLMTSPIIIISKVCTNIKSICTSSNSRDELADINRSLVRLKSLNTLNLCVDSTIENMTWFTIGLNLTLLIIDKISFVESDFLLLGRSCTNLINLTVMGESIYEIPEDNKISKPSDENELIFSSLISLKFKLNCLQNLRLFFHPKSQMKKIIISVTEDDCNIEAMLRVLQNTICLPKLEELHIVGFICPDDLKNLVSCKCPSLNSFI